MNVTQEITLSELQRKRVWEGWLSCEMRGCYFAELVTYYQRRQQILAVLAFVSSSGAALAIATQFGPNWPKLALTLFAALCSSLSFFQKNGEQALICSDLQLQWNRLANGYQELWDNMYSDEAPKRFAELSDQILQVGKRSAGIPYQERRMRRLQQYIEHQHVST